VGTVARRRRRTWKAKKYLDSRTGAQENSVMLVSLSDYVGWIANVR
jgi:hypothetical protein